jgi:tetratricopeptide (TPR) repeat protein
MRIEDIDKEFQDLADSLRNGEEAYQRGDMQQAEQLLESAYGTIQSFGDQHPDLDACMSRLADVYYSRRRYGDAIRLLRELYQIRGNQLGFTHPSLVPLLFRQARNFERLGKQLDAEYNYLQALGMMNQAGMPDRASAATIVESYARMLRTIEGREEEGEQLEEQARDLRNMSREKLNLEIIKNISFDGIDVVDLTDDVNGSKSGIGSLRKRSGGESLEPRPGTNPKVMLASALAVMLLVSAGSYYAWHYVTTEDAKKKKAAAAKALAAIPKVYKPQSVTFRSVDGIQQLIVFANHDTTFVSGGVTTKGKADEVGGSLHFKPADDPKKTMTFAKDLEGFDDESGVPMYKDGAKELQLAAAMRKIADGARASYHAGGGYLASVPTYTNPFNGASQTAAINNIGTMDRNVSLEKMDRYRDEANQVLTWNRWSTGRTGAIDIWHFASGDDGDTLYIKGTDAHGTYLRSSAPQNAFVIQLVNGDPKL